MSDLKDVKEELHEFKDDVVQNLSVVVAQVKSVVKDGKDEGVRKAVYALAIDLFDDIIEATPTKIDDVLGKALIVYLKGKYKI